MNVAIKQSSRRDKKTAERNFNYATIRINLQRIASGLQVIGQPVMSVKFPAVSRG